MFFSLLGLTLQTQVKLLFDPFLWLWLVSLDINVIYEGAQICQTVQVGEQFVHIVGHFLFVRVFKLETLFIQSKHPVHTLVDVLVVDESFRCFVRRELQQQNGVPFVLEGCLRGRVCGDRGGCLLGGCLVSWHLLLSGLFLLLLHVFFLFIFTICFTPPLLI